MTRALARPSAAGTWRALLTPRRAVPLALVIAAAVVTEWSATRSALWVATDVLLIAAFCLYAPHAWRVMCSGRSSLALLAGAGSYLAGVAALVALVGALLPRALGLTHGYVLDPSGLPIIGILLAVGGWGLGRDVDLEAGFEAERDRARRLAVEAERAELLALRANLDPHFLFNTLNAIAEWCREDPAVAEAAMLKLASVLRTMLEGIRSPSWPLEKELDIARAVLELHAIRDRERYAYQLDAGGAPHAHVPPMILLPLIENAITHGPAAGHEGTIAVRVCGERDRVIVDIDNPGAYRGRRTGGEGLAMVERRLRLAYGADARLELSSDGDRTTTILSMPVLPMVDEALS